MRVTKNYAEVIRRKMAADPELAAAVQKEGVMRDPLTDPIAGDVVEATVNGKPVSRCILKIEKMGGLWDGYVNLWYSDSRQHRNQCTSPKGWRRWCKKNNAKVIEATP